MGTHAAVGTEAAGTRVVGRAAGTAVASIPPVGKPGGVGRLDAAAGRAAARISLHRCSSRSSIH